MDPQKIAQSTPSPLNSHGTQATPSWWIAHSDTAWERVKDAFRRDWEQTRADVSSMLGTEHNQSAGDTLNQAVGSVPDVESHTGTQQQAAHGVEDMVDPWKASWKIEKAARKMLEVEAQLATHFVYPHGGDVTVAAGDPQGGPATENGDAWQRAEPAAHYGYSARTRGEPAKAWDQNLENDLRRSWEELRMDTSWAESRDHVRHGWDYGDKLASKDDVPAAADARRLQPH